MQHADNLRDEREESTRGPLKQISHNNVNTSDNEPSK